MEFDIIGGNSERTVAITGRVTFKEQNSFRELITAFFSDACPRYVIDLSNVQNIDSAGLGMLLIARKRAQGQEAEIVLRRPPQDVLQTLELAKFHDLFSIEA